MMKFFGYSDIKKQLVLYVILTSVATAAGFALGVKTALFVFAVSVIFSIAHFAVTACRYKRISELSASIDKVLHGAESFDFADYSESEISILQNEIVKMTVRLREQSDLLKKEKIMLADSIADISHQIRTPLTSMNLITAMLQNPNISDEKRLECMHRLKQLLSKIDFLINALLKLARIDAGAIKFESRRVEFDDLINIAAAPLAIPLEIRCQQLKRNISGGFEGDIQWTAEAVGNILKNCSEHTADGGTISVKTSENAVLSEIVIEDNGSGIDEDDLMHMFERFYKGKNSSEQSIGIGLALSREIINNQNGTVKAANRKDGGAVFSIKFYKGVI